MGKGKSALESQEEMLRIARSFYRDAVEHLSRLGYRVVDGYIVGSRARGDYTVDSDVDIVLIVEGVEDMDILSRLMLVKDILYPGVDPMIYTPGEWGSDRLWIRTLRSEAIRISPDD